MNDIQPVQVALGYLQYCRGVEAPGLACCAEGKHIEGGRALDVYELRSLAGACELLTAYFGRWTEFYHAEIERENKGGEHEG